MSLLSLEKNVSNTAYELEEMLSEYYADYISDEDLWSSAREYKEVPVLGNIYQDLIFNKVVYHFIEEVNKYNKGEEITYEMLDCSYYINSVASNINLFNENIYSSKSYWKAVVKAREHFKVGKH